MSAYDPIATGPGKMDRSGQIEELAKALVKAQGEIKPAVKDATNPYFKSKYADLASVMDACRPALVANGIAVVQRAIGAGDTVGVTTTLMHTSGQWIEGTITITLPDMTAQSAGSAITYLRRYSLASIVGVCPEDDDAEAAQPRQRQGIAPANDNGSARRAGTPPALDGNTPPSSSAKSVLKQWRMYDDLRASMGVSEDEARERVSHLVGRRIGQVNELSYAEMDRVIGKMQEAAGGT